MKFLVFLFMLFMAFEPMFGLWYCKESVGPFDPEPKYQRPVLALSVCCIFAFTVLSIIWDFDNISNLFNNIDSLIWCVLMPFSLMIFWLYAILVGLIPNKYTIGIIVLFVLVVACTFYIKTEQQTNNQSITEWYNLDEVYISTGSSAKRFHADENCKGLRNSKCIKKVSLNEAMNRYNRTPCQWCCKESASEDKQYDNWGD